MKPNLSSGLEKLLSPARLSSKLTLKNRLFMSSMNRCRAEKNGKANNMMIEYYKQRSSAGIIFTEPLYVSQEGLTREFCSAMWSDEYIDNWRRIVERVRENEGVIYGVLSHGGRTSHTEINGGIQPISPSSIAADIKVFAKGEFHQSQIPREMNEDDIKRTLEDFHQAAIRVKKIEFDGICLHATSGSLVECFIKSNTNLRTDSWGGDGGLRFPLEIIKRFKTEFSEERISIKINPFDHYNDMNEVNPRDKYIKLINLINSESKICMFELKESPEASSDTGVHSLNKKYPNKSSDKIKRDTKEISNLIRKNSFLISNFGTKNINDAVYKMENDLCDFISIGTFYVSNPNLPYKLYKNLPIILPEENKYYTNGKEGYIDYE